jgi:hypothetical protein
MIVMMMVKMVVLVVLTVMVLYKTATSLTSHPVDRLNWYTIFNTIYAGLIDPEGLV